MGRVGFRPSLPAPGTCADECLVCSGTASGIRSGTGRRAHLPVGVPSTGGWLDTLSIFKSISCVMILTNERSCCLTKVCRVERGGLRVYVLSPGVAGSHRSPRCGRQGLCVVLQHTVQKYGRTAVNSGTREQHEGPERECATQKWSKYVLAHNLRRKK